MADLVDILQSYVADGLLPGYVGVVADPDRTETAVAGAAAIGGSAMERDSIFRLASLTKPITAAAVMLLVDDGQVALDDPVRRWLPELAEPSVVRTAVSPVDDVVPAVRPITVLDLLTSQAGYGFGSDFTLPAVQQLLSLQRRGGGSPIFSEPEAWVCELARIPMLFQPGEAWLYDTCSTLQGILISRVTGQDLPSFLSERLFEPLGMIDTGFEVPEAKRGRFTTSYRTGDGGELEVADTPDGQWRSMPPFPLGNGGLAGTADDWLAFGQMLLADGTAADGRRLLTPESVHLMTTDHTVAGQREIGRLFLKGQGWGSGGSVDIARTDPWNVPGRYGWFGDTGTSAHIIPANGRVAILLTQAGASISVTPRWMRDFWCYATATG
jgi:CubicO group peptidase (beta-lactamase class C family)